MATLHTKHKWLTRYGARREVAGSSLDEASEMFFLRMASSGTLRRVALVRTDVSEELSASIIRALAVGRGRGQTHLSHQYKWA
jgi:hypothetical protein